VKKIDKKGGVSMFALEDIKKFWELDFDIEALYGRV